MKFDDTLLSEASEYTRKHIFDRYTLFTFNKKSSNSTPIFTSKDFKPTFIKESDILNNINYVLTPLFDLQSEDINIEDHLKILTDRISKTKERWIKKDSESEGILEKEVELMKSMYLIINSDSKKFLELTGANDPQAYKGNLVASFKDYASNDALILGEYRYIQNKQEWQIISALKNDTEYVFYKKLTELLVDKKIDLYEVPRELVHYPMDTTNSKIPVDMATMEKAKRGDILYVDLDVNKFGDIVFKSRYDVSMFKDQTVSLSINRLGKFDQDIISYLLSTRNENFYRTREVITTIGDIAKNIPWSKSGYTYLSIRESLFRLQYLTIVAVTSELRGFSLKILDNVDIIPVNNKDTVRVLFNEDVVQQVANKQTMLMYGDVVKNFSNPMSTPLLLNLQIERIRAFSRGEDTFKTSYNTFKRYLFFKDNTKARNIKKILEALDEIVSSGKTVKGYVRKRDNFVFTFYPISETERHNLFRGMPIQDLNKTLIELNSMEYQLTLDDVIVTE